MTVFNISSTKAKILVQRMKRLSVKDEEIEESFIRSSGPGGQNVNKVATCVYLCHRPTGISVKCQKARSQGLNRCYARGMLLDEIEKRQRANRNKRIQAREKKRRQNRRRSKFAKEKMKAQKRYRSEKKSGRRKISLNKADVH